MRGMLYRWRIEGAPAPEQPAPGVEPLVARVLAARGLVGERGRKFLDPRLTDLHDPSLLPGADRAAERILDALRAGERVVVYGDYDVDGVASTAILVRTMLALAPGANVGWYVPHRIEEGYGLGAGALEQLAREGAKVVVSVDCGVTAVEPALAARRAGLDLIITDHHNPLPGGELPDAYCVVHPRIEGSAYPYADLAGAGVAFKLAWRLATMDAGSERVAEPLRELLLDMLALAALGTIADVAPLEGENRVIARYGLARLRSISVVGVQALIDASKLRGDEISSEKVGFILGPRLNACGRMGHAREAVELMLTEDAAHARTIAAALTRLNDERRETERVIAAHALELAEQAGMTGDDRRGVVLAHPDWHPGVIGIVCSRLVERLHRPVVLMQDQGAVCAGSCRSVDGFNIAEALSSCAAHLLSHGGHDLAAGLRLERAKLEGFTAAFIEAANAAVGVDALFASACADCEATLDELTPLGVKQLEHLAPFGRGNPQPRVVVRGLRLTEDARAMGAHARHASFTAGAGGVALRFVAWGWGERRQELRRGVTIDAMIEPRLNAWRGRESVEPTIVDVRLAEPSLSRPSPIPS